MYANDSRRRLPTSVEINISQSQIFIPLAQPRPEKELRNEMVFS